MRKPSSPIIPIRRFTTLVMTGCILLLLSCSNNTKQLLIGRWKYDKVGMQKSGNDQQDVLVNELIGELMQDTHMEFRPNGTCIISTLGLEEERKYSLEDNGKTIATVTPDGTITKMKVIMISNDKLVVEEEGMAIGYMREQ